MPTAILLAAVLLAPLPAAEKKPAEPTTLDGRWHGVSFDPKVHGRHDSRYTLTIEKGKLTLAGDGKVLMSGVVAFDMTKKSITYTPQAGKAWGEPVPGTFAFHHGHLTWKFHRPGEGDVTWMFGPAWVGPPVKTTLQELGRTPEKFACQLVEIEAVVAEEPRGNEVDARTTYGLQFVGNKKELPHFYIHCDGEPTVHKGDVARLVGRFHYRPQTFVEFSLSAMDPDCKVVKVEKKK